MERSAINSYSAAGATIGILVGLYVANMLVGASDPGFFYSLAGIIAIPFAAGAHVLVSRVFKRARRPVQLFLAVSGWVAFFTSVGVLLVGIEAIFPKAAAA